MTNWLCVLIRFQCHCGLKEQGIYIARWLCGYMAMGLCSYMTQGVLQISSDRDDNRIFWGVEIFDFGIFLGRKILATCFVTVLVFWKFLWLGNAA